MGEVAKADRRGSGDFPDIIVGPRAVPGGDRGRQPAEHDAVAGVMMPTTSATVSASGPVGSYTALAWASGSASVSTATAAMSAATNAYSPGLAVADRLCGGGRGVRHLEGRALRTAKPSRSLALVTETHTVSLSTVRKGIGLLKDEGLVVSVGG